MRQRVGFARALVVHPNVLLMDEPFSALDVLTAETLRTDFLDLWCEGQLPIKGVILVTHNIEEAVFMCDRILVFSTNPGRVVTEIEVDLPQPRDRLDPAFRALVERIYVEMTTRPAAEPRGPTRPEHFPGTGIGTILPRVSTNLLSGLIEAVAAAPYSGHADLPVIARSVHMEVDELFPVAEALQMLRFAEIEGGDIRLSEAGKRFADAALDERKKLFEQRLLNHVPLSRLHKFRPHIYGIAAWIDVMVEHGTTLGVGGDGGAARGSGEIVAIGGARRGRSGAGDLVDPGRAGRRGDRAGARCPGGSGAQMARRVPGGRRRRAPRAAAPWAARRTGGGSPGLCPGDLERGRTDGLDPAAAQGGDHASGRGHDLARPAEHLAAAKGGFAWRRPRHCLRGRQDAEAVERSGLRLKLLRQQARAGDIRLLFADESEALTHPYLAHLWAKRGADLRIEAPGRAHKRAILGALDHVTRRLVVATSATKRSADFIALLARLDGEFAPTPGHPGKPVVLILDNGPIHTSRATAKALAARPWLTIEWLPKYAPELNDIERSWRDLKRHHLAHQTFTSVDQLDTQIHRAVAAMNQERMPITCPELRMAA